MLNNLYIYRPRNTCRGLYIDRFLLLTTTQTHTHLHVLPNVVQEYQLEPASIEQITNLLPKPARPLPLQPARSYAENWSSERVVLFFFETGR